jgi:hypothetical protein
MDPNVEYKGRHILSRLANRDEANGRGGFEVAP